MVKKYEAQKLDELIGQLESGDGFESLLRAKKDDGTIVYTVRSAGVGVLLLRDGSAVYVNSLYTRIFPPGAVAKILVYANEHHLNHPDEKRRPPGVH